MGFDKEGKVIGKIPVNIHHRIIELFSAGLYSSPNKAFEELVCNSYDANADKVSVYLPTNTQSEGAIIWVCDNGESMDSNGLRQLWKIGYSKRRKEKTKRLTIGKFGIGKLATYVLANKLTYICKTNDLFKALTMHYDEIPVDDEKERQMELDERQLSEEEVKKLLEPIIKINDKEIVNFKLWGKDAEDSWTMAILSNLKDKAHNVQEGRLKWILRTALPLSPGFNLFFNGVVLESSKISLTLHKSWVFGEEDAVAEKFNYPLEKINDEPIVNLPNLKGVKGRLDLYYDSLVKNDKSQGMGRSHGIFLMIRGRLINIDNPLIGSMAELNHAAFNRMRIIVYADELDNFLTSGRESVKDCDAFSDLQKYINQKFNEARTFFQNYSDIAEKEKNASFKVSKTSTSLSRRPLITVAKRFFNGEIDELMMIDIPDNLNKKEQEQFIARLEEDLLSETGIIKEITTGNMLPEDPISKLDLDSRTVKINLLHPFFANFLPDFKSTLPLKLIATTEILTEAFLIESGIDPDLTRMVMEKRDGLLREMTYKENPNATAVAMMIKSALADSSGLEDAVFHGFNCLGFKTTKIGGNGKPDGKAIAILGICPKEKVRLDYSITYDAKSTSQEKIKAGTIKASACVRHRTDYGADFSAVIAIDFEGADDENSAASKEAVQQKVTLIRAEDFWKLVLMAVPNQLNYSDLKEFFEKCFTVKQTHEWIENLSSRVIEKKPIKELLETTAELAKEDIEPPNINAIRIKNDVLKKYSKESLIELVNSIHNLVPRFISIDKKENVRLETTPEKILEGINKVVENQVPPEYIELFIKAFESKKN